MDKEVNDALHMLLHCALKDKEFETQKEQFEFIYKHIEELHNKIDKAIEIIEGYNLGKYDYSIPPIGIIKLLEILKDSDVNE